MEEMHIMIFSLYKVIMMRLTKGAGHFHLFIFEIQPESVRGIDKRLFPGFCTYICSPGVELLCQHSMVHSMLFPAQRCTFLNHIAQ